MRRAHAKRAVWVAAAQGGRRRPLAAGGLVRERWRVVPTHELTRARQRARERASAEGSVANDLGQAAFGRAGAAAWQAACGAAGFRSPTAFKASERRAERGARRADACPAARAPQVFERAARAPQPAMLPSAPQASARRPPGCV